jgi:hypothetical protein
MIYQTKKEDGAGFYGDGTGLRDDINGADINRGSILSLT